MNTNRYVDFFKNLDQSEQKALIGVYFNQETTAEATPTRVTSPTRTKATAKRARRAGKRVVVPGVEAQAKILAYLNGNSADKFKMGQIVKATGYKVPTTQNALRILVGEGKIYSAGERGATRYSASKAGLKAAAPVKATRKVAKKVTRKAATKVNSRIASNGVATA